jgi:hypothetical protein
LSADITADPSATITYPWTIEKSVEPAAWELFRGDTGTSTYTVKLTKGEGVATANISGEVCVTNGGAVATEGLAITVGITLPPDKNVIATTNVDTSAMGSIAAGASYCYGYRVVVPYYAGNTYKATAHVTITNHSGQLGEPFGPDPSGDAIMPSTPTEVNASVNVEDTNGGSWPFNESGSVTYSRTFSCDTDKGLHENTARILETGDESYAVVDVECYALGVTKTAGPHFTRTYHWKITKEVTPTNVILATGEQIQVDYKVVVNTTGYTDSAWSANGDISVNNPAPIAATINSVTDLVSPNFAGSVTCGVSFPYQLAGGGTLNCTYTANLPDAVGRTNTATVTMQNYARPSGVEIGTTDFSGAADVKFGDPDTIRDDDVTVYDDGEELGTVSISEVPKTFTYGRYVGPYEACGTYQVVNTAKFVANTTGATGQASATVSVTVPCGGCTLTQGYWKTHSKYGPAPYDDTWTLVGPAGEDELFFSSSQSYYEVLWTAPAGNPYYILAHQYIAAELNILNGASTTQEVLNALSGAEKVFDSTPDEVASFKGPAKNAVIKLANILDQYNNGFIGPGHCSE